MSKKEYKQHMAEVLEKYPSVSYAIADKILKKTGKEVRVTVPGHMQRGGTPCAYDRVLSSRLGTTAALMISKGEYGNMVAIHDHVITSVPLKEVAGKLKTIDPKSDIIAEARLLGISSIFSREKGTEKELTVASNRVLIWRFAPGGGTAAWANPFLQTNSPSRTPGRAVCHSSKSSSSTFMKAPCSEILGKAVSSPCPSATYRQSPLRMASKLRPAAVMVTTSPFIS